MPKRRKVKQIPAIILKTRTGYSAHSPVVDGCIATGKTIDETLRAYNSMGWVPASENGRVEVEIDNKKYIVKDEAVKDILKM